MLALLMPIRGMFPPFYYSEYNAVRERLESIPGLTITSTWKHEDVILEDCGFDVAQANAKASITFFDDQDWKGLFRRIDGIIYGPAGQQKFVSRSDLESAGFEIDGLADLLQELRAVQQFCETAQDPSLDRNVMHNQDPSQFRHWIRIGPPRR